MRSKPLLLGILLVLSLLFISGGNTVSGASPSILISEVAYDGIGSEADSEFVELYNPTGSAIDLSGWTVADNFATFTLSGSIPAGGFYVIADNQAGFETTYGVSADLYGSTLALANSGDEVTLSDASSTVIDYVAWEGYSTGWNLMANTGDSLHRTSETDTDSSSDFVVEATNPTTSNYLSGTTEPDTEAPTVSITNPTNGETVYRGVTISTSSSDNIGVTSQEITIDGQVVSTSSSYYWDTETYTDGTYTIATQVWDDAGNTGTDSISVTVDNANAPPEPAIGEVKFMTYNVEASGANADWKEVVKEENADILLLVETGDWDNSPGIMQGYCDEFNTYFAGLGEDPYNCVQTTGVPYSTSGEAIFSRYPVVSTNQIALLTLDDGSTHDPSHDFLHATVDLGAQNIELIAAHLKCCGGADNENKRTAQQEGIINYMDGLGDVPIIYAGDLNSFSPEDTGNIGDLMYQPMSMMLEDTTYGDLSSKYSTIHTWDDPLTTLYPGQFFPTYGHQNPQYTSRIDFIVANHHFTTGNYVDATVGDTATADTGSDHYSTDFTYNFGGGSSGDTTPPSQVTGLSASAVSESQIDLSWTAATDDTGVDHYNIYRDGVFLTSTSLLSYSDTGLAASTTYTYEVSAVDAAGNEGALSSSASATTDSASDTTPPSQVTGLTATTVSDSEIALNWDAATDNVAVDYYKVYRDGALYTTTPSTSLNDIGLSPDTTYTYEVSAVDTSGNEGALSASASATTDSSTPATGMYVSSITLEKTNIHPKNGKFDVLVQVTILDEVGNPVVGADVIIDFQVPRGDIISYIATTDSNGVASFVITPPGHSSTGTFTATVTDVIASGFTYDPQMNVETSDSATLV